MSVIGSAAPEASSPPPTHRRRISTPRVASVLAPVVVARIGYRHRQSPWTELWLTINRMAILLDPSLLITSRGREWLLRAQSQGCTAISSSARLFNALDSD